jgi:hypothetical protein
MLKRTLQLLIVVCIVTGTSWAADDPFAGKWKLDSSRSQFPADTMKVESGSANKYTFIFSEPNTAPACCPPDAGSVIAALGPR